MVVSVLVEISFSKKEKTFDYLVPNNLVDDIKIGKRVLVPFGKQKLEGFIIDIKKTSEYELKEIKAPDGYVLGEEVYQVIVDENANYNILLKSENELIPTYENGKYNLYNEPLHKFTIVKKDSYDGV